ncbi:hypothetical protein [Mycoplasma sp. P36-A1]|uniref:hypothetical protein n=1 Tax=Mycoplasma sp. P36-A1 TaxID=3252900 RepID=UPI003C3044E2
MIHWKKTYDYINLIIVLILTILLVICIIGISKNKDNTSSIIISNTKITKEDIEFDKMQNDDKTIEIKNEDNVDDAQKESNTSEEIKESNTTIAKEKDKVKNSEEDIKSNNEQTKDNTVTNKQTKDNTKETLTNDSINNVENAINDNNYSAVVNLSENENKIIVALDFNNITDEIALKNDISTLTKADIFNLTKKNILELSSDVSNNNVDECGIIFNVVADSETVFSVCNGNIIYDAIE